MTSCRLARRGIALGSLWLAATLAAAAPALGQEEYGAPPGEAGYVASQAPPASAPPPPSLEPAFLRAWNEPADSLEQRVARTRRAALESGTWSFDPAARAVLGGAVEGDALVRAEAAVALAPQLPLAHMELASAYWLNEDAPMAALRAMEGALRAIASHPEGSLWFAGSGLFVLAVGVSLGTLVMLLLVALRAAPHAAHDLGHLAPGNPPPFARFALLAALLLVPIAAGEGVFGLALALLCLGVAYGSAGQRVVLALAALALWAALYPMARVSAAALEAFPNDSVARAAYSLSQGLASQADLLRLEAAPDDPLALRALAIDARRRGHLGRADALYQQILASEPRDVAVLNNAGNVRLALGHMENAIELYGRALDSGQSPVVLFNLSQAFGRGFHVDDLNRVLADAQRADGELVAELTALQRVRNESFVVDLPLDVSLLWRRVLAPGSGEALAASLRAPWAPGHLARSQRTAGLALGATLALGIALGVSVRRSSGCSRCGSRTVRALRDRLGGRAVPELRSALQSPRAHRSRAALRAPRGAAQARPPRRPRAGARVAVRAGRRRPAGEPAAARLRGRARCRGGGRVHLLARRRRARSADRGRRGARAVRKRRGALPADLRGVADLVAGRAARGRLVSVGLSGNLQDFGLADVFQLIGQQRKTGVLELRSKKSRVQLVFDRGAVVSAAPVGGREGDPDPLAEMLVRCGLLTRERAVAAEDACKSSAQPLARVIVDRAWIAERELARVQDVLTRDTIFEVLRWTNGSFDFLARPVEHERDPASLLGAEQILMDGLRMLDEWRELVARVPSDNTVFQRFGRFETYSAHLRRGGPRTPRRGAPGLRPDRRAPLGAPRDRSRARRHLRGHAHLHRAAGGRT